MHDNRDSLDFATAPIGHLFRRMFIPTITGMVSIVILNITDGAFVGHGAGSDALAAVNIVAPLFLITSGIGLTFGIGSNVAASLHLAKGNNHAANINLTQGLLASVLTGLIIGTLALAFPEATCRLFGCSPSLMTAACSYLRWIALSMPLCLFGTTAMFMVRLDGSPRFAMTMNCIMAAANILLDYILIFPLNMGLEGAAIATSTSFGLGSFPILVYILRYSTNVHLHPLKASATSLRLTLRNIFWQTRTGLPALLGELAIASVIIVGNYVFMSHLGEDGVAAWSVACYCLPIAFMAGNAIVQSAQPIISFAYGAGNTMRLNEARSISQRTALFCGLAGMATMWVGADSVAAVFLPGGSSAHSICSAGLPLFSAAFLFVSLNIAMIGNLQSTEAATPATLLTIMRGFILPLPCFMLLAQIVGTAGLWLALPAAEAIACLIIMIHSRIRNRA